MPSLRRAPAASSSGEVCGFVTNSAGEIASSVSSPRCTIASCRLGQKKKKKNALRQKYFCEIASSVSSRAGWAKTIVAKKKKRPSSASVFVLFVLVKQVN